MQNVFFIFLFVFLGAVFSQNEKQLSEKYFEQSQEFHKQGNYKKAWSAVGKSCEISPQAKNVAYKAMMLFWGQGVEENYDEAFELASGQIDELEKNADAFSCYMLGNAHLYGIGFDDYPSEEKKWYLQAVKAKKREGKNADYAATEAMYQLGLIYDQDGEPEQSIYWFKEAAKSNHGEALMSLAMLYFENRMGEDQQAFCVEWFEKSARGGNIEAMMYLGFIYETGINVEKNEKKAKEWLDLAVVLDDGKNMNRFASMFQYNDVYQNYEMALYWFNEAAKKEYAPAMTSLGMLYEYGEGVEQNYSEALGWYKKGASYNDPDAMAKWAWMLESGLGVDQDYSQVAKLYEEATFLRKEEQKTKDRKKAFDYYNRYREINFDEAEQKAAEMGEILAIEYLASEYWDENNRAKAQYYYQKAMDLEVDEAEVFLFFLYNDLEADEDFPKLKRLEKKLTPEVMTKIGDWYREGDQTEKNFEKAVKWYRKAASLGYAEAMCDLGARYENGEGVEKSLELAVHWYQKSAEKGYDRGICNLGTMYEHGEGVEKDLKKAVGLYRESVKLGYARGMCNLGVMYEYGKGVDKDLEEAVKWYRKSAEGEYARGMANLGTMYEYGEGVKKDLEEAVKWYERSYEYGYARGAYFLGDMYEHGKGVERSLERAVELYREAARDDYNEAKKRLEELSLSEDEDFSDEESWEEDEEDFLEEEMLEEDYSDF